MRLFHRWILGAGVAVLWLVGSSPLIAQQSTGSDDQSQSASITVDNLPDSPGTTWARLQEPAQQSAPAPSTSGTQEPNAAPPSQDQTEPRMQRPVGTAAAEAPKVSGITAAQPAGIAIAPAKQRRVRILVLKVGAIIGAGAAIGTVVALTAATPSKPPGAH